MLEDFRYLLMACRQLGSRIKKSVVLVEVVGVISGVVRFGREGVCILKTFEDVLEEDLYMSVGVMKD